MAATEVLLVQIFERKNWIINQAKHQVHLFEQRLASQCLIDGIALPPWLLSSSHVPNNNNGVFPECPTSNVGRVSNGVPQDPGQEDPSVTSPEHPRKGRTSDSYYDPALSLDRVQRSKSRQRALEIRNSEKKSCSRRSKNFVNGYAGGAVGCAVSSLQSDHADELNLVKAPDTSDYTCEVEEAKAREFQSKEISADISSSKSCDAHKAQISAGKPVQIERDLDLLAVNSTDSPDIPNLADHYAGRMRSTDIPCVTEGMSVSVNPQDLDHESGPNRTFVPSVNQTADDAHKVAIVDAFLECGLTQNVSPIEHPEGLQMAGESSVESLIIKQELMESNLSDVIVAEPAQLAPEENAFDSYAVGNRIMPSDSDLVMVSSPCSVRNTDAKNLTVENSCANSLDETNINLAWSIIHSHKCQDDVQNSISNDSDAGCLNLTECELADKPKGRSCSSSMEGSWPQHKGRKLMHKTVDHLSAPPGLMEKVFHTGNRDSVCGNLGNVERSPKAVLQSPCLSTSGEGSVKLFPSKSPVQETHQTEDQYMIEASESSPREQTKRGEINLGSSKNGIFVSSVNQKAHDAFKVAIIDSFRASGLTQNLSFIEIPNGLQARERSLESLVKQERKESILSDVLVAEPAEVVSEENILDCYTVSNPIMPSDSDFALVSSPCSLRNPDARNLTVENPCANSLDEANGNLVGPIIHSHSSPDDVQESIGNDSDAGYLKSTECQIADKPKRTSCSSSMERSWPQHKGRKIIHKIVGHLSASPGLMKNVFHTANRDSVCGNLGDVERSPKAVFQSQGLSNSRDGSDKSFASKSPGQETHQTEDQYMIEASGSSPREQMKWGDINLGSMDESVNASFTFTPEVLKASLLSSMTKQAAGTPEVLKASLLSSMTKQAVGTSGDRLIEETGVANPTRIIVDAGSRCIEGSHVSLPLQDNSPLSNVEHLTCTGRIMLDKRLDLGGISKFSHLSVGSRHDQSLELVGIDNAKPEFEGFVIETDDEPKSFAGERISFDQCNMTLERASVLEQICKSACMQTPVACSSASSELHQVPDLCESVPTRLLEGVDMRVTIPIIDSVKQLKDYYSCLSEEVGQEIYGRSYSESLQICSGQSPWDIKKPSTSPVGKSSSRKRRSLNPLPCIGEENENTDEVADTFHDERVPLADINDIPNLPATVSDAELYANRLSIDSVNTHFSLAGTRKSFKQKPGCQNSSKRRYNNKENLSISRRTNGTNRTNLHRLSKSKLSGKPSLRKGTPSLSEREPNQNNIVTSMTSFIPLVQQKQAAAIVTGKRDIKVKALEAAEAAKRIAEKKEHERQMKKEALKLERSRIEQENQLELQKKKKEAELATKKRQREEEDRKERERKRLRVGARRQQKGHEVKLPTEKEEKEKGYRTFSNMLEPEPRTSRVSTSNSRGESIVHEERCESLTNLGYDAEVPSNLDKAIEKENLAAHTVQEQSYDISPFRESDDESEENEDVLQNAKFTPSWASKNYLGLAVSRQSGAEPEAIFPQESFFSISEFSWFESIS